jgi:hypothetical protein
MSLARKFPYLVNGSMAPKAANDEGINLFMTLRFGEDKFQYALGTVAIAVRRAHVNLQLTDCTAPEDSWSFDTPSTHVRSRVCLPYRHS